MQTSVCKLDLTHNGFLYLPTEMSKMTACGLEDREVADAVPLNLNFGRKASGREGSDCVFSGTIG